ADAVPLFERALQLRPDYADAHYTFGLALMTLGEKAGALEHLDFANALRPDWPDAMVAQAWILATDPEASIRDGARAVQLAGRACQLTRFANARYVDPLAAAYAEAGQFGQATAAAEQALALAQAARQTAAADRIRQRIDLYT